MNLEIHYYPIESLIEYDHNSRKNDVVVNRMCASIREFGFRIPIVAKSDGTVVDGHLRLKASRKLGMESIPVVLSGNLNDAQIEAFRLFANQSANWAKWDDDLLKLEIQDLENLNFDFKFTGFELEKIQRFLDDFDDETREKEDFSDLAGDGKKAKITKPGNLWILVMLGTGPVQVIQKKVQSSCRQIGWKSKSGMICSGRLPLSVTHVGITEGSVFYV